MKRVKLFLSLFILFFIIGSISLVISSGTAVIIYIVALLSLITYISVNSSYYQINGTGGETWKIFKVKENDPEQLIKVIRSYLK